MKITLPPDLSYPRAAFLCRMLSFVLGREIKLTLESPIGDRHYEFRPDGALVQGDRLLPSFKIPEAEIPKVKAYRFRSAALAVDHAGQKLIPTAYTQAEFPGDKDAYAISRAHHNYRCQLLSFLNMDLTANAEHCDKQ